MKNTILFALILLSSCSLKSRLDIHKKEDIDKGPYYKATSASKCESEGVEACLELVPKPQIPKGYSIVRVFQNPSVFEAVALGSILPQDRKTLEAAALVGVASLLETLDEKARAAGYELSAVNIDPLCAHSDAIHNGFFKENYGTDKKNLTNLICVGRTFSKPLGTQIPLALDPAIVAHEFYHALFASDLLSDDKDQKILRVMSENHDLEALSEGLADHFSYTVRREFDGWFVQLLKLFYREPQNRSDLTKNHDFFSDVYRDGQRFTELNNLLFEDGVDSLSLNRCMILALKENIKKALAYSEENRIKWNRIVSLADIKVAYEGCAEKAGVKEKFSEKWDQLFPSPTNDALATEVELSIVAISNQTALCSFATEYGLNARSFQRYQYLSPCSDATSVAYKDRILSLAKNEQSPTPTDQVVWMTAGLKLNGSAFDCRLRSPTALLSELALYADGALEKVGFTLPAPASKRGSWYRDIPFGSFLTGDDGRYKIAGPLSELSAKGFRFTPIQSTEAKPEPDSGLSGLILLPSFPQTSSDKETQDKKIAERLKATFLLHYRDSEDHRCTEGQPDCKPFSNFFIQCSSHRTSFSDENPLGSYKYLPIKSLSVSIYDCSSEGACSLKTY